MRALSWMSIVVGLVGLSSCRAQDPSWKEQWVEIRASAVYAEFCSMEICDGIEGGYVPECDCWCSYDGDEDSEGTCEDGQDDVGDGCGGDDGSGGDEGGDDGDDGSGGDEGGDDGGDDGDG